MAPNLTTQQRAKRDDLICNTTLKAHEIADEVGCSIRAVEAARSRRRAFGDTRAPPQKRGPRPSISPHVLDDLKRFLSNECDRTLEEMQEFLEDEHGLSVSERTIRRSLKGWSKKIIRRVAKEQRPELRDYYMHQLSRFRSYQLIYIDESGCNRRDGYRRKGWSPRGVTPRQVGQFQRGPRHQILPAYTQDGVLHARVFEGSTDTGVFEDFIREVLDICSEWVGPRPVLIMDNASFHRCTRMKQMCVEANVGLLYLPPYSPDFNPIEEFFAELKAFIKQNWRIYEANIEQGFATFLVGCIEVVGKRRDSARGHFRHAGVTVETR